MKKRFLYSTGILFLGGLIYGVFYINSLMPIITGYPAKFLCSAVFISNRDVKNVEAVDLNFSMIKYVRNKINYQEKSVTSFFLWGKSKAIYREGFGAVLLRGDDELTLKTRKFPVVPRCLVNEDTLARHIGNAINDSNTGINKAELQKIKVKLIDENGYHGNAFGFLAIHKGIRVIEGYKPGFNEKTRFLSWSIAKSFNNALVGILVNDGLLSLDRKAGIPAWQSDERNKITLNNLLQMESGLEWNEDYGNRSDVTMMLYGSSDFAGFALNKRLSHPPGSFWYYSSGTANIIDLVIRRCFNSDAAYYDFAPRRLFNKTGMSDVVFETDPSGLLAGSSYIYATARDYGRFGMLYLRNGVLNGERLLPEGWVNYTATPAAHSKGRYGASFWLNGVRVYPDAPGDMFFCNGHDGQRIFIIPSKDLVVVVLGFSPKRDGGMNFNQLLKDIIGTLNQAD
ncbi:MAG: serine hydrolase [Bacteroidetes bacterium]|nr:serine hydrolase [Bacteroidota bacterium]